MKVIFSPEFRESLDKVCIKKPRICKRFNTLLRFVETQGTIPKSFDPRPLTNSNGLYELDIVSKADDLRLVFYFRGGDMVCIKVCGHNEAARLAKIHKGGGNFTPGNANRTFAAHYEEERLPLATGAVYGAAGAAIGGLIGGGKGAMVGALGAAGPAAALTMMSSPTISKIRDLRLLRNYASNPDITKEDVAKGQALTGGALAGAIGSYAGAMAGAKDPKLGAVRGATLGLPLAAAGAMAGYANGRMVSGPIHDHLRLMGFKRTEPVRRDRGDLTEMPYTILSNDIRAYQPPATGILAKKGNTIGRVYGNKKDEENEPADKDKSTLWSRTKTQVAVPAAFGLGTGALMGAFGSAPNSKNNNNVKDGFFKRRGKGMLSGGKWGLIRGVGSGVMGAGISEALAPAIAGARTIKENWGKDKKDRKKFYISDSDRHKATMLGHIAPAIHYGRKDFREAKSTMGKAASVGFAGMELATNPKQMADEVKEGSQKRKGNNTKSSWEINGVFASIITPTTKDIEVLIKNPSGTHLSQFDIETALREATVEGATAKLIGKPVYNPDRTVKLYIRLSRPSKAQEYLQSFTNLTGVTILTVGITAGLSKLKYFKP